MDYTLELWHAEHANFAALLNLLDDEVDVLRDGGSPDYPLMLDIMYYMTHYSDVLHHPKEDLVFARVKARDESIGPTIDELTNQHTRLRHMGEAMVRALDGVMNDSITLRADIEATARAYVSTLRAHMRVEESEVLPRADRLLNESDWVEIDAAIASFDDPLLGSEVGERYARLRQQITLQSQAHKAATR